MQLSQKQKTFSEFFLHFWNLDLILTIFKNKKKIILIPDVFLNLSLKNLVRYLSKMSRFRGPFHE